MNKTETDIMNPKLKSISRIDHKHTHGWYVRVKWKHENRSRFFADLRMGGRQTALAAAILWRDEQEREVKKPRTERAVMSITSRNKTGVPGVYRRENGFVVTYSPLPRQKRQRLFSFREYGSAKEAFAAAVKFRESAHGYALANFGQPQIKLAE